MSIPEEGKVYDTVKREWVEPKDPIVPVEIPEDVDLSAPKKEEPKKEEPKKEEEKPEGTPPPTKTPEQAVEKVIAEQKKSETTNLKKDEVPAWIKDKYGIDTVEGLQEVLESNDKLANELEKERNKKVFSSEKEEKLHKFLKDWDLDMIGEGMQSAATLLNMDIENIDQRKGLEEAYIIENTDLTREEAKALFNKEYRKKYEIKKESFDTDEEYEEEKKIVDIQLKKDFNKAKKLLIEKKDSLRVEKKPEKKEEEVPVDSIRKYAADIDKYFTKFDKFVQTDEAGNELYTIPLSQDQRGQIKEAMQNYIQRKDVYDKSGKINNFDLPDLSQAFAEILFGKWMNEQRNRQIRVIAQGLKAEQIAGKVPDKVSKAQGKASGLSLEEQFREKAKEVAAKRAQNA